MSRAMGAPVLRGSLCPAACCLSGWWRGCLCSGSRHCLCYRAGQGGAAWCPPCCFLTMLWARFTTRPQVTQLTGKGRGSNLCPVVKVSGDMRLDMPARGAEEGVRALKGGGQSHGSKRQEA